MIERLMIYCDGSCPKPYRVGGWAFIILIPNDYRVHSGAVEVATNQTMELCAALKALREVKRLKLRDRPITLISDSQYLVNGMTAWKARWTAEDYSGIDNTKWWRYLHMHQEACADIRFEWVKGHGSSRWNKHVDEIAGEAQRRGAIELSKGDQPDGV